MTESISERNTNGIPDFRCNSRICDWQWKVINQHCHHRTQPSNLLVFFPAIEFTLKGEALSALSFLDISIYRSSTKVYRKETYTDRMLPFESNHPMTHKASRFMPLFNRFTMLHTKGQRRGKETVMRLLPKKWIFEKIVPSLLQKLNI